jgi:hypothetical protein
MTDIIEVLKFIRNVGRPLDELNPGSKEFALTAENAIKAIDMLSHENKTPVLGGDVLSSNESDKLYYAYQLWGAEFQSLNWYCNQEINESKDEFIRRSYKEARESISVAVKSVHEFRRPCFFVLVL